MDTISRENNSIVPIVGVIAGALALILAAVALVKLSSANKEITDLKAQVARIDGIEASASSAASTADSAKRYAQQLAGQVETAFKEAATKIGAIEGDIAAIKENLAKKAAAPAPGKGASKEPAVAGPGEYIVKSGDVPSKIAKNQGVSVQDLISVNPTVNWKALKIGQKLKLPKK